MDSYERKNHQEILDYFSEKPSKLIIINIEKEGWINYVCSKLHFRNKNIDSKNIHKTKSTKKHQNIVKIVNETLEQLNYDKKSILFTNKKLVDKYTLIYNTYI